MLLLPHDTKKRQGVLFADDLLECDKFHDFFKLMDTELCEHFDMESNHFYPATIRNIHRQYMQLDRDKNGMISASEMKEYGKKKAFNPIHQQPTHDLTPAFIAQVFSECPTYPPEDEMDYKAYIDFTLLMADKVSPVSLRFVWDCLDFQKQGFLDKFTIDYFLRDLVEMIRFHDEDDTTPLERLR
uniref:EF-hand domain-containing protein n=1 Tax=Globisporangium ultimum (strain ATCC 200006 / CBS 805.95 / DAOM BR144) TaxID=431595 RepID=K3WEG0_GLOUD